MLLLPFSGGRLSSRVPSHASFLASKSFGSWAQPARFSSNVIESVSAKHMLSHLQTPEMRGYKLLGLPFDIMNCKLVQSYMTTLHAALNCLKDWKKHKAELDLGLLHGQPGSSLLTCGSSRKTQAAEQGEQGSLGFSSLMSVPLPHLLSPCKEAKQAKLK